MNLNELRDRAYKIACEHGFHDKEYADKHWLMLIITELSEVVEADRKDSYFGSENNDVDVLLQAIKECGDIISSGYWRDNISETMVERLYGSGYSEFIRVYQKALKKLK